MITIITSTFEPPSVNHDEYSASSATKRATGQDIPIQVMRKSVTFENHVRVETIPPAANFSQEDKDNLWYSQDEYTEIKEKCFVTIQRFQNNPRLRDCSDFSSRGLEILEKRASSRIRKENKRFSLHVVLEEQETQEVNNNYDPERIRDAYRKISTTSTSLACFTGARDRDAVLALR